MSNKMKNKKFLENICIELSSAIGGIYGNGKLLLRYVNGKKQGLNFLLCKNEEGNPYFSDRGVILGDVDFPGYASFATSVGLAKDATLVLFYNPRPNPLEKPDLEHAELIFVEFDPEEDGAVETFVEAAANFLLTGALPDFLDVGNETPPSSQPTLH